MYTTIYIDGKGTRVTSREFITRDAIYLIKGIIDARMNQVKTSAVPAIFCIVAGLLAFSLGAFHLLRGQPGDAFHIGSILLTPNRIAVLLGFFILFSGIAGLLMRHKKYAVHIITTEGERDTVISTKKIYVRRIVLAIRKALKTHKKIMARYWIK